MLRPVPFLAVTAVLALTAVACGGSDSGGSDASGGSSSSASASGSVAGSAATPTASALTVADAYAVGCPLLDANVGGGRVAKRVAIVGLQTVEQTSALTGEQKKWADDAISLLETDKPNDTSRDLRREVVDQCREHGHPLSNVDTK